MLDENLDARRRLESELIVWLTTVAPDGRPQSSAVWFVIEGGGLLIYSGEASTRIGNLEHNPRVAVNSRGDRQGDTLVTMEGRARIDRSAPAPEDHSVYLEKYGAEIERLGWTPTTFSEEFPVALRITIDRIRTW